MNTSSGRVRPPLLYDFLKGHPNDNELPVDDLQVLFRSVSNESLRSALQYGLGYGNVQLIHELKSFIQRQCDTDIGPDDDDTNQTTYIGSIFITEGVSHSIDLLTVVATQPGDYVLTEQPTYFLIAGIFHTHKLNVRTMPMLIETNGSGSSSIDFDALENNFLNGSCPIPRLIYIIPAYHNPTGRCMTNDERKRLTLLAHKYKILVVADEVYHLLDWTNDDNQPQQYRSARMVTWNSITRNKELSCRNEEIDDNDTIQNTNEKFLLYGCVSVSSFTKIFGPGIRCGWIEAESHVIHSIQNYVGYIQSQGAVGPVIGSILAEGLANRIVDNVVQRLRDQYQIRCYKLCDILERESALQLTCRPTGGYFVWIRFASSLNLQSTNDFLEYCLDHGVRFMPGARCDACPLQDTSNSNRKDGIMSLHSYARFCFAKLNNTDLEKGAEIFLYCFRSFMKLQLVHDTSQDEK
jgi:DNA-binding transcriptional MocR family regulator